MVLTEVFPNPTVKQVVFQIQFPSLFYLESKVGELQLKIMDRFPESALLLRRRVVFADIGPEGKMQRVAEELEQDADQTRKLWQFATQDRSVELSIQSNSLSITSERHKTYRLGEGERFRDTIETVTRAFLEVVAVPRITRIGLRYVDDCPVPRLETDSFLAHYNTTLPLARFDLGTAREMSLHARVLRGRHWLSFSERLDAGSGEPRLTLDFDGYATDIASEDFLAVTDELHDLIVDEFERSIKEPVYEYMRRRKGE